MPTFAAGMRLTAQLLNDAVGTVVSDTQNTLANTSSAAYSETLATSNTPAACVFVAPSSGTVLIHNSAYLDHSAAGRTHISYVIRVGGSIGSGTVFLAAADAHCISNLGADDGHQGLTYMHSGLTPGATYNVRQAGKATSATGEIQNRHLVVQPVIA